jgi:ABC-type Fe3+-citrate transport system substrate-binding protein
VASRYLEKAKEWVKHKLAEYEYSRKNRNLYLEQKLKEEAESTTKTAERIKRINTYKKKIEQNKNYIQNGNMPKKKLNTNSSYISSILGADTIKHYDYGFGSPMPKAKKKRSNNIFDF